MKKITLLLLLLTFSFSYSQVVLTEDFEAGLTFPTPSGWTVVDLSVPANGEVWTLIDTGFAGGFTAGNTFAYDPAGCEGNYATFDSDGYGNTGTAEESLLVSPVFDCSSLTQVTLSYNHIYSGNWGGLGTVEAFNGTSWVTVQTLPTAADGSGSAVFGLESLDVSAALAGVSNAQIRFRWTGNWSISWSVDNISVFQCTVNAPSAVTTPGPTDGAIGVVFDQTDPNFPNRVYFSWVDGAGDPADTYTLNLGTANPPVDNSFSFTNGDFIYGFSYGTTYYWSIEATNCAGTATSAVWSFTTEACTLTAPGVVSTPGPADLATDVVLDDNGGNPSLNFSWIEGAGDPATSFTINIDTSNPPVANSFTGFTNGDPISGLAISTTYYWSVDAVNCGGTTPGPVWSFTTASTLSTEENDITLFNVYPNPVKDVVKIDTELSIDSILILNHLGQNVFTVDGNRINNNEVDLSSLTNGLYFMNISAGNKSDSVKIIKE